MRESDYQKGYFEGSTKSTLLEHYAAIKGMRKELDLINKKFTLGFFALVLLYLATDPTLTNYFSILIKLLGTVI